MPLRVILCLALSLGAVLAGGCKKKNESAPAGGTAAASGTADLGPMDPLVAEIHAGLAKHRDEMCNCSNIQCADDVQFRMGAWLMQYQGKLQDIDTKSTPAQIEAAKKISAEHDACAKKLVNRK